MRWAAVIDALESQLEVERRGQLVGQRDGEFKDVIVQLVKTRLVSQALLEPRAAVEVDSEILASQVMPLGATRLVPPVLGDRVGSKVQVKTGFIRGDKRQAHTQARRNPQT